MDTIMKLFEYILDRALLILDFTVSLLQYSNSLVYILCIGSTTYTYLAADPPPIIRLEIWSTGFNHRHLLVTSGPHQVRYGIQYQVRLDRHPVTLPPTVI